MDVQFTRGIHNKAFQPDFCNAVKEENKIGLTIWQFQIYLLIFARVMALLLTAPLLSSDAIPGIARAGLAMFVTVIIFPWVRDLGYQLPSNIVDYFLLVIGEALIGVILGFFLGLIYSIFQLGGEFFAFQMGFGASSVFDPLAQVEVPLMGQYLNLVAMLVFVTIGGFQKVFISGVWGSFKALKAIDLVTGREYLLKMFAGSMGRLFETALTISFPIVGTIFVVYVCMGLLAKAAPQMNLLMLGFPISIGVAFLVLLLIIPFIVDVASRVIEAGFTQLETMYTNIAGSA
ncbi:MAG: flagellar biosynthetic protein FliR [Spirochaetaceae bacterium]|nr:MAG: flagellar biosynthetic protein FliR [Spirochaetaceae bacterium]